MMCDEQLQQKGAGQGGVQLRVLHLQEHLLHVQLRRCDDLSRQGSLAHA